MAIRILKIIIGLAIAALGFLVLDPARWTAFTAAPLSLHIPPTWYDLRLERLWLGSTGLLLGVLSVLACLVPARRR